MVKLKTENLKTVWDEAEEQNKGKSVWDLAQEAPDYGMIALPKEELPGVWDYDKQLDQLLGDPEIDIEDMLPLDVKYDFGQIVGMTEKPDETKDRMKSSLFYMVDFGIPPGLSYQLQDAFSKQKYGKVLSPKELRNRLSDEHFERKRQYYRENLEPFSLFGNAFLQSLAGKPAMALKGAKVYTPGEALGIDWFLTKTSEYLENLRSREKMTDIEAAATGKLWPIDKGASWYQIDPKLLPETINTWAATVGDQIPIMLMTLTGREIGKVTGKPIGTGVGGLYALITGGPEPTDVVTAPVIAKVTEEVVKHLSGAAPLIAMEAGGFMDRANAIGLDNDIAEKYARPYGLGSGAIEYSQWLWNLKAFKMLSPKVKMSIMKKVLIEIGGATWEGIEELSQQGLENFLIGKAIEEQKARTPEYDVEKPETWAGGKRAFGIGLGVSLITRLPGHAYTTIRSRKLAKQIQEQTDATKKEAEIAVEAMAEGGRVGQEVTEVIAERFKAEVAEMDKKLFEIQRQAMVETQPTEAIAAPEPPSKPLKPEEGIELLSKPIQAEPEPTKPEKQPWEMTRAEFVETVRGTPTPLSEMPLHRIEVEKAVKEGKPVRREVLEDYKTKPWAQEALKEAEPTKITDRIDKVEGVEKSYWRDQELTVYYDENVPKDAINIRVQKELADNRLLDSVKKINLLSTEKGTFKEAEPTKIEPEQVKPKGKAPKELLGGVAKELPGLTKAEVEHLGKREQEALRAAQRRGLKVGYKKGVAETITDSRRSLDAFRMKEAISQKGKMDVASVVLTYVPKEKQGDYIRRILEAKTQKRIERLTEAIDKYLDKYEKRQAIKGFKQFVKGIKKKYRRGEVAFGYLPKKLSDKLVDVLDKFDLAKISEKKEETLESRLKFVTKISGELAEGFEQLNADLDKGATDLLLMGTRRIEELKRLNQKYIGDLDVDEIGYIQVSLEHLIKINDLKGQSKERRRIEALRTHINQARQEVLPSKEKVVELTGILGAIRWLEVEGQSVLRTLVGLATGKDKASTEHLIIDELEKANIKRKTIYKDFIMHFRKIAERKGIKWSNIKDLHEFTKITIGGKEIEIDYDNLLSIYAHIQAEGNLRRLLKTKGLNITIYKRDEHGIFTKKHTYRLKKPTLAELRAISELIPEKHKKILDVYFKSNWEKQTPAINETSMAYQNYELARQEKYYHVSREIERAVEGRKSDLSISIDQQSRALPRTGGNARINIKPFTHEVMDNMQWSAAYHAMTIPMENARTLVANIKWREAMKNAGQYKALREITTMLRRSQGLITEQSVVELTASKLLGTVGKSILSLRFSGSLVQTASVPAAVEFIDSEYLSQIDIPKPSDIKHLKEISPVLWMRWEAKQFDFALGIVGAQNAFETLLFEHSAVTDKFLFPYTAGDEMAIAKLFMAAQRQIEAKTKFKRGTEEFQDASLDLLYKAMSTQPQWDMIHRSPLTSDPSVLARSITMFMSARNAQRNVVVRAIDDYRKGRITKGKLSERIAAVGTANLLVSVARHTFKTVVKYGAITALVAMGIRKAPDDEEIKKEAERLAKKIPLETIFNFLGLDALGTLFTSMGYAALKTRKYGWGMGRYSDIRTGNMLADLTLDFMQLGIDFTMFTDQIISGEKYKSGPNKGDYKWETTGKRLIDDIALLIAYRFGLPYEGPKSDIIWPIESALKEKKGKVSPVSTIKRKEQ